MSDMSNVKMSAKWMDYTRLVYLLINEFGNDVSIVRFQEEQFKHNLNPSIHNRGSGFQHVSDKINAHMDRERA